MFRTEQRKIVSSSGHYQQGLSTLYTPGTPQQANSNKTFEWTFATNENQKDVFSQLINEHLKCSTAMETPATPSMNKEGNDEQKFYSTPSSRMFIYKTNSIYFFCLFSCSTTR
jgi:hypothetical protein